MPEKDVAPRTGAWIETQGQNQLTIYVGRPPHGGVD